MFTSLRSRLWLTYFILVAAILSIIGVSLLVYLLRNPAIYRQSATQLRVAETVIVLRTDALVDFQPPRLDRIVKREDGLLQVRVLILDRNRAVLADSRRGTAADLLLSQIPFQSLPDEPVLPRTLRDANGVVWFYRLRDLDGAHFLLVAMQRPKIALQNILRDEFGLIVARVGTLALVLSLVLGMILSQWISAPLRQIAKAADAVAKGDFGRITPHGPREVQELVSAFNEMTRRVQAGQQSQRDFVANVSHELKTPLTSIQGFAQAILDGAASTPEALQQAAGVIYSEAGRMHRLVMDLLTLARLDAGTADLKRAPVELGMLLQSVCEKLEPQARQARVNLKVDLQPLPGLIGDEDRLAQVFTNLVDNAIKYTPAGGQVVLSARLAGDQVEVSVADNGPGLSAEDQARIFERFFQADRSRRGGSGRGVGLGLAIARQIVTAHGGTIQVISSPGQGSTFVVKISTTRPDDSTLTRQ